MIHPDIGVGAALIDAPEHLAGVDRVGKGIEPGVFRLAPHQPAISAVYALLHIVPGGRILNALVKGHANVAAQIGLDLHTLLRPHKNLMTVNVGGEGDTLLLDLSQRCQTEHLKSPGIRENRSIPGHELMQSTHLPDNLIRGAQMQMVGIAQLHLTADVLQILRTQGSLDGSLCADIHKNRCLHGAMGTGKYAATRLALCFLEFKHSLLLLIGVIEDIQFCGFYGVHPCLIENVLQVTESTFFDDPG